MQYLVVVDDSQQFGITFARTQSNLIQKPQIPDPSGAMQDDPSGATVDDPSGAMVPDPSGAVQTDMEGKPLLDPAGNQMPVMLPKQIPLRVPVMIANPRYFATDEAYMISRNADIVSSYVSQAIAAGAPGAPSPAPSPAPAPSPGVTGTVQELPKWKVLVGLARDGIKDQVVQFIGTMSPEAQALWDGATAVQRNSPLFTVAKTAFGWTDAMIDDMFARYSLITVDGITG